MPDNFTLSRGIRLALHFVPGDPYSCWLELILKLLVAALFLPDKNDSFAVLAGNIIFYPLDCCSLSAPIEISLVADIAAASSVWSFSPLRTSLIFFRPLELRRNGFVDSFVYFGDSPVKVDRRSEVEPWASFTLREIISPGVAENVP